MRLRGSGQSTEPDRDPLRAALAKPAARLGVTPGQVALAWVHHQERRFHQRVVPLPGATSIGHLRTNVAAASLELTDDELQELSAAAR